MSLTLYYHPLSSFCWKVLVALYENATPFEPRLVDLGSPSERAAFCEVWRPGRFPVLRDAAADRIVPESSIIIEYLAQRYPGPVALLPADPDAALRVRARDRLFDIDIHIPMQKIVTDGFRPEGKRDPFGVEAARKQMRTGYALVEDALAEGPWACGEAFTMADCAAAPALAYADMVEPLRAALPRTTAYLARLRARPSFARVLVEAEPYMKLFPGNKT